MACRSTSQIDHLRKAKNPFKFYLNFLVFSSFNLLLARIEQICEIARLLAILNKETLLRKHLKLTLILQMFPRLPTRENVVAAAIGFPGSNTCFFVSSGTVFGYPVSIYVSKTLFLHLPNLETMLPSHPRVSLYTLFCTARKYFLQIISSFSHVREALQHYLVLYTPT